MKSCVVYKSNKEIVFVTYYLTDIGIGMLGDPIFRLSFPITKEVIEQKIDLCLAASKINIPRPPLDILKANQKNNLKKMGFSSYPMLYKNTKSYDIELSSEGYLITPNGYYDNTNPAKGLKRLTNETKLIKEKNELVNELLK
jgi:hypothetical protein